MNDFMTICLIVISALILAWVGSFWCSNTDSGSFHIENKQVGLLKITCGIFSVVGGGELIAISALSYRFGLWSVLLFGGFAIGTLFFIPLVSKVRKFHKRSSFNKAFNIYSIPDYAFVYHGRGVSALLTIYTVLALGSLLLIQLSLGGYMIEVLTGLPAWCSVILMAVTVGYYVYRGGFNGILVTDLIQIICLFFVFLLLSCYFPVSGENTQSIFNISHFPDLASLAVFLIGGICWVLGGPDIWQRILAARSDQVARKALGINTFLLCILGVVLGILGSKIAVVFPEVSPELSFFAMLSILPSGLKSLVAIGLIAALLSTSDTELHAISTLVNKEFSRNGESDLSTARTRQLIILVAVISAVLAITLSEYLLDVYFVLLNIFMLMGGGILPVILGRGSTPGILVGLVSGGVILLVLVMCGVHLEGAYSLLVIAPPLLFGFTSSRPEELHWKNPVPATLYFSEK